MPCGTRPQHLFWPRGTRAHYGFGLVCHKAKTYWPCGTQARFYWPCGPLGHLGFGRVAHERITVLALWHPGALPLWLLALRSARRRLRTPGPHAGPPCRARVCLGYLVCFGLVAPKGITVLASWHPRALPTWLLTLPGCVVGCAPPGPMRIRHVGRWRAWDIASVLPLWHTSALRFWSGVPQGQDVLALWHTGALLLALWSPGTSPFWPCGTQGHYGTGLVAPAGITRLAPDAPRRASWAAHPRSPCGSVMSGAGAPRHDGYFMKSSLGTLGP